MDFSEILSKASDAILTEAGVLAFLQFLLIVYLLLQNHFSQLHTRKLNDKIYNLGVAYTQAISDITEVLDSLMTVTKKSYEVSNEKEKKH